MAACLAWLDDVGGLNVARDAEAAEFGDGKTTFGMRVLQVQPSGVVLWILLHGHLLTTMKVRRNR